MHIILQVLIASVTALLLLVGIMLVLRAAGNRAVPYVFILSAILSAWLGFTAYEKKVWWFVPPAVNLILAVYAFVRQRKIASKYQLLR